MSAQTGIEWCDSIDPNATGRVLGAYKVAAARTGCTVSEWIERRLSGLRWCFRCRVWKSIESFTSDRSRRGKLASTCRPCTSDASTASRYGMKLDELRAFREQHGNACGICKSSTTLYVDHDHETGKPRGLLCPSCNTAIGLLNEEPARFAAALAYLENSRG